MHRGIAHTAPRAPHATARATQNRSLTHRLAFRRPAAGGEQGAGGGLDESTLARLRQAEEETARLRAELASLQSQQGGPASSQRDVIEAKPSRIDSTDRREDLLGALLERQRAGKSLEKRTAWLSEGDVEFVTDDGAGASSTGPPPLDAEAEATVQRRLLLGGLATAALAAFAFVPTDALRVSKPAQPLYAYAYALLQIEAQLNQCGPIIEDAAWGDLRFILARITGTPGNARQTLGDAAALLPAGAPRQKAEALTSEFCDYLAAMDFNTYYDTLQSRGRPAAAVTGAQSAEFVRFSREALGQAQRRLSGFLALVPRDDLDAARARLAAEAVVPEGDE